MVVKNPDRTVTIQLGHWTVEETAKGSNWCEATNLARAFLADVCCGVFDGKEVWMVADNLVFSLITNKGMSKSKGLSDMVLQTKTSAAAMKCFGIHSILL